jgi:hypothetical protein
LAAHPAWGGWRSDTHFLFICAHLAFAAAVVGDLGMRPRSVGIRTSVHVGGKPRLHRSGVHVPYHQPSQLGALVLRAEHDLMSYAVSLAVDLPPCHRFISEMVKALPKLIARTNLVPHFGAPQNALPRVPPDCRQLADVITRLCRAMQASGWAAGVGGRPLGRQLGAMRR